MLLKLNIRGPWCRRRSFRHSQWWIYLYLWTYSWHIGTSDHLYCRIKVCLGICLLSFIHDVWTWSTPQHMAWCKEWRILADAQKVVNYSHRSPSSRTSTFWELAQWVLFYWCLLWGLWCCRVWWLWWNWVQLVLFAVYVSYSQNGMTSYFKVQQIEWCYPNWSRGICCYDITNAFNNT